MKLSLAILALSASAVSSYQVGGGFDTFGRPYLMSPRGRGRGRRGRFGSRYYGPRCGPPGGDRNDRCVDQAFEELAKELNKNKREFRSRAASPETIRQQEEWINRAFGLASDVAKGMASTEKEAKEADDSIRKTKEFVDQVFGLTKDVASGGEYSSVRSEVLQDDDTMLQVALDVPGVKANDIDVTVEGTKDKILVVRGERKQGTGDAATKKFSKLISLDARADTDGLTANLEDGVLVLTVPRFVAAESTESIQKIAVSKVSAQDAAEKTDAERFPFELELDVPGVTASNIEITVEGSDGDKTLKIVAVREMGTDADGKPRTRETSRSYKVDDFVDTENIVANLSDGVLTVSAPADEEKTSEAVRKIAVNNKASEDSSVSGNAVDVSSPEDGIAEEKNDEPEDENETS